MSSDTDSSGEMVEPLPAPTSNLKSARQTPPPTELQAKLIALSKQQKASDPPHLRRPSDDKIDASRLQSTIQTPSGRTQDWYENTFSSELGLVEASEIKRRESALSFHSMTNNDSEAAGSESGAADNDSESGSFASKGDKPPRSAQPRAFPLRQPSMGSRVVPPAASETEVGNGAAEHDGNRGGYSADPMVGWSRVVDNKGRLYYWNRDTGQTSWRAPVTNSPRDRDTLHVRGKVRNGQDGGSEDDQRHLSPSYRTPKIRGVHDSKLTHTDASPVAGSRAPALPPQPVAQHRVSVVAASTSEPSFVCDILSRSAATAALELPGVAEVEVSDAGLRLFEFAAGQVQVPRQQRVQLRLFEWSTVADVSCSTHSTGGLTGSLASTVNITFHGGHALQLGMREDTSGVASALSSSENAAALTELITQHSRLKHEQQKKTGGGESSAASEVWARISGNTAPSEVQGEEMRLRMAERALRVARGTSAVQPGVGANALQTEFAQAAGVRSFSSSSAAGARDPLIGRRVDVQGFGRGTVTAASKPVRGMATKHSIRFDDAKHGTTKLLLWNGHNNGVRFRLLADTENNVSGSADVSHYAAHERETKTRHDRTGGDAIEANPSNMSVTDGDSEIAAKEGMYARAGRGLAGFARSATSAAVTAAGDAARFARAAVSHASASAAARWHRSRGRCFAAHVVHDPLPGGLDVGDEVILQLKPSQFRVLTLSTATERHSFQWSAVHACTRGAEVMANSATITARSGVDVQGRGWNNGRAVERICIDVHDRATYMAGMLLFDVHDVSPPASILLRGGDASLGDGDGSNGEDEEAEEGGAAALQLEVERLKRAAESASTTAVKVYDPSARHSDEEEEDVTVAAVRMRERLSRIHRADVARDRAPQMLAAASRSDDPAALVGKTLMLDIASTDGAAADSNSMVAVVVGYEKGASTGFRSTHTLRFMDGTEKRMVLWNGTNNGVRFIETGDDAVSENRIEDRRRRQERNTKGLGALQLEAREMERRQEMAEAERQAQFVRERAAAQRAADKAERESAERAASEAAARAERDASESAREAEHAARMQQLRDEIDAENDASVPVFEPTNMQTLEDNTTQSQPQQQQQQQGYFSGNDEEREKIRQQIAVLQAKLDGSAINDTGASVPSTPSRPRGMLSPFKTPWTLDSATRSSAKRSLEQQLALAHAENQVGPNTNADMFQRQATTNQQPMFILCTPEQLGALSEQDSALIQRKARRKMQEDASNARILLSEFRKGVAELSMNYARRLDKLKLRQQITLCGRGGAARTDARWNIGLAPAIPEDGGMPTLVAQQLSRAEAVTDKVTLLEKELQQHILDLCQQDGPKMAVLGKLPSSVVSPKPVWR